jgi:hypothetical protein
MTHLAHIFAACVRSVLAAFAWLVGVVVVIVIGAALAVMGIGGKDSGDV